MSENIKTASIIPVGTALVVDSNALNAPQPQTAIAIAVDTAYVVAHGGGMIGAGVYMIDNRARRGSTNEGGMELHTYCNVGDMIGFEAFPINEAAGANADIVKISGFNVSQGSVFGAAGFPREHGRPNYWVGAATKAGSQTYQISLTVTTKTLRPYTVNVYWDPFITAA